MIIDRRDVALGAAAGVLSSLAISLPELVAGGIDLGNPMRVSAGVTGLVPQIVIGTLGGVGLGLLYPYRSGDLTRPLAGGLLIGLLAWIIVELTLVPTIEGGGPDWSTASAQAAFPTLPPAVLFGAMLAFVQYALGRWRLGDRPMQAPISRTAIAPAHRVVILGGGFGGVAAAQRLEQRLAHRTDVEVTLVSRENFLLFTPMLAEVAAGSLMASHISTPLRAACPRTIVRRAEVVGVDGAARTVTVRSTPTSAAEILGWDHLVVALGAVPSFHGLPGVGDHAFTMKTLADATVVRDHVIGLLEEADGLRTAGTDPQGHPGLLTIVVAGGGFAGCELIAELADFVRGALVYFPRIEPADCRFVLVHSRDRILPELGGDLAAYALERLRARGIEFRLEVRIASATPEGVELSDGTRIATRTFVWTAGNEPAPLIASVPGRRQHGSALITDGLLRVLAVDPGGSEDAGGSPATSDGIWAVGDCAAIPDPDRPGQTCPPTAQHALRQGRAAADNVLAAIGGRPGRPFAFRSLGSLVVLGHNTAAAEIRGMRFSGLVAWYLWRGIYLSKLPGIEKKVRVAFDWLLDLAVPRDIVLTRSAPARSAEPHATDVPP